MAIYKKQFRTSQPITSAIRKDGFLPFETSGFTFGFEIEGVFHKDLEDSLPSGGTFKEDGSVSIGGNCKFDISDMILIDDGHKAKEYNSPVFKSIEELIACLRLFTKAVYYSNKTCGVHLHIGYKQKGKLHNKFYTEVIMKQLESRFMPLICPCVKERIQGQDAHWCNLHEKDEYRGGRICTTSKYRAVNLHHSGTIELRLFAPCPHLIANIQKVLTEFFRVGYRDYNFETSPIVCVVSETNKVEIVEVMIPDKQVFDYGFNKNKEFAISPLAQIADFINYENADREVNGDYQARRNYELYRLGREIPIRLNDL